MPTHLGDGPQRFASLRRTLIRKTSLLHKIDPTARRSSFADMSMPRDFSHDRLASLEIPGDCAPLAASQPRVALGSISSSRCQITCAPSAFVHRRTTAESALIDFLTNEFSLGLSKSAENGCQSRVWWSQTGSNRRPPACKAGALPTELWPRASRH